MNKKMLLAGRLGVLAILCTLSLSQKSWAQAYGERELGNFISRHAGAKIIACSGYDTLTGLHPEGILEDSLGDQGMWRSAAAKRRSDVHWVIIELPEAEEITTLTFDTKHFGSRDACPRNISVEFSTEGPFLGYFRVAKVVLQPGIAEQVISSETSKAKWIRISVYNTWGNSRKAMLGRVYAYNDVRYDMTDYQLVQQGKIELPTLSFERNSDRILPASLPRLEIVAQVLMRHPEWLVKVEGHTDSDGSYRYNMVLSQKRADAVKAVLIAAGLDESRIEAKGFGFSKRVSMGKTASDKAKNRRVMIVVEEEKEETKG